MAGRELARSTLGTNEYQSGNLERALKHWTIAASAGNYISVQMKWIKFCQLCMETRSEARYEYINIVRTRQLQNHKVEYN